jgi:hypothetical protein
VASYAGPEVKTEVASKASEEIARSFKKRRYIILKRKQQIERFTGVAALTIIGQKWRTRPPQIPVWERWPFRQNKPSFLSVRSGTLPPRTNSQHLKWHMHRLYDVPC